MSIYARISRLGRSVSGHDAHTSNTEVHVAIKNETMPDEAVPLASSSDGATRRPKVSIGVPVYNGAKYLELALDSLLAQDYKDLEIVISDNASTDETEAICRAVMARDPRVRYSRNETNRGLVWNHRRVIAMATGEYFMFAPYDDWFSPHYVGRCVEVLDANPEVVYVVAESILVDKNGVEIGREITRQRLDDPSPSTRFWDVLVVRGGINWYGLSRRALFDQIAPHRSLPRGERIVQAELALRGPFRLIAGDWYWRRIHDDQLTSLRGNRRAETLALDPTRKDGWRNSVPVLLAEYVVAYVQAVHHAPLGVREKLKGYARVAHWVVAHAPGFAVRDDRAHTLAILQTGAGLLPEGRDITGY